MSTNSYVGKLNKDGKVRAIYTNWDGYLSGVGRTLFENYEDTDKIDKLLDLGNLSSLGEEPVSDPEMWNLAKRMSDNDYRGCVSYRDRGETKQEADWFENEEDYLNCVKDTYAEYCYLFKNDEWFYAKIFSDDCKFLPLTEEAIKKDN